MTDGLPQPDRRPLTPTPSNRPKPIWLLSGLLMVADRDLPEALRKLAEHADLCAAGFPSTNIGGLILHGRLRLRWSVTLPTANVLPQLVEKIDPAACYRLLTITVAPLDLVD